MPLNSLFLFVLSFIVFYPSGLSACVCVNIALCVAFVNSAIDMMPGSEQSKNRNFRGSPKLPGQARFWSYLVQAGNLSRAAHRLPYPIWPLFQYVTLDFPRYTKASPAWCDLPCHRNFPIFVNTLSLYTQAT